MTAFRGLTSPRLVFYDDRRTKGGGCWRLWPKRGGRGDFDGGGGGSGGRGGGRGRGVRRRSGATGMVEVDRQWGESRCGWSNWKLSQGGQRGFALKWGGWFVVLRPVRGEARASLPVRQKPGSHGAQQHSRRRPSPAVVIYSKSRIRIRLLRLVLALRGSRAAASRAKVGVATIAGRLDTYSPTCGALLWLVLVQIDGGGQELNLLHHLNKETQRERE